MSSKYSVTAIGDASKKSTFSGIPYHFWHTAQESGLSITPWKMDMERVTLKRKIWNVFKILQLQSPGGFQYSQEFNKSILKQIPDELLSTQVISFNQHFPPVQLIYAKGGKVYHYIDATFKQLLDRYGFAGKIGYKTKREILAKEIDQFTGAEMIFTFQQWAKDSVVNDYKIPSNKVKVVMPGANIVFDTDYVAKASPDEKIGTKKTPLVLGFVGKDWKRKGLLRLVNIRDILERRGWEVIVRCAGYAPGEFKTRPGVEFVGFIDKTSETERFIKFLESCHIGCLFSEAEFSSISVLEFISVGRPVAGFVVDGMGDLFMPECSIRHVVEDSDERIADSFERYLLDSTYNRNLKKGAELKSNYVRWGRAVKEVVNHIATKDLDND
ncbi:glycosyltransferase family 4 protein [Chryseosolibacter indicus]|uniref:Glycosyltransferase family 4 protein n=1 Tax=Chryseosolibacter indicus TaxID=2782351 RepID=A0ABS5VU09_9BACT|nr:glycosyltransferase family 4 protein [Chryseosolibacter indicus]MBT1704897.1 glycosyltransferase family 4 protein [Chryseosolibacter indicus]